MISYYHNQTKQSNWYDEFYLLFSFLCTSYVYVIYCRALVEVKPVLYITEDVEAITEGLTQRESWGNWGFQQESWHDSILNKCVIKGRICAAALCINDEAVVRICPEHTGTGQQDGGCGKSLTVLENDKVARFCTYLLDKVLWESELCWDDIVVSILVQNLLTQSGFHIPMSSTL